MEKKRGTPPEALKEKEPEKTFDIGRSGPHEFEVYETAIGEEAAVKAFLDEISNVSSPSEIRILEKGSGSPRRDLEKRAEESFKLNKELKDITLED